MKIIISPAKKMEECSDMFEPGGFPVFLDRTKRLHERLCSMSEEELKELFKANDRITRENFERYQAMDLDRALTPALLSYVGIQYQYMAPHLFSHGQWEYVKNHLRILSGFYGILRPDDRVTPYRLEMQARLAVDGYSKAIEPFLTPDIRFVTCVFGVLKDGKVKIKATEAKMARGEMVRFLAENNVTDVEAVKGFSVSGYGYSPEHSEENSFVFIKNHGKEEK